MRNLQLTSAFTFVSALFVVTACSSASSTGSGSQPVTETCSGTLTCRTSEGSFPAELHKDGDRCFMGKLELMPDGHTSSGSATWSTDGDGIRFCVEGQCFSCAPPAAPATSGSDGQCTGSPDLCSEREPGDCSSILGCSMHVHVRPDGSYENTCVGSPRDCDGLSRTQCARQGCTWK